MIFLNDISFVELVCCKKSNSEEGDYNNLTELQHTKFCLDSINGYVLNAFEVFDDVIKVFCVFFLSNFSGNILATIQFYAANTMSTAHLNNNNNNNNNDEEDGKQVQGVTDLPQLPILQSSPNPRRGSTSAPKRQLPAIPKRNTQDFPPIAVLDSLGSTQQMSHPLQPPENDSNQSELPRLNPENIYPEKNKKRVSTLMSKVKLTILRHETIQDKKPYTVSRDIMM